MDIERFDDIVRSLPGGNSRRRVLAATLCGVLGYVGLSVSDLSAAKACKGLKGKKKKKCLKKAKQPECRNDGDCPDQVESCQRGVCKAVCSEGACAGCPSPLCTVNLQSANKRSKLCAAQLIQVAPDTCATDADCTGNEGDVCVRISSGSCTQSPCGGCFSPNAVCEV